ncbi:uncharacterized protein LOC105189395 [Harpegnathos saltator]|uniref:uncharacterized protein LOC105189395 n=1 Tax=Harpegnathos saltator TaxID=610380 RepID=UPI000948C3EC|nr:uncharacterized protein LOC105189395 [Harpegnathos saltator]
MSENTKTVLRPRVRFSQLSNKEQNNGTVKESCKNRTNLQINGPKIKNIVTLERPVRIMSSTEHTDIHEKDIPLKNCEMKVAVCFDDKASKNTQNTSLFNDNVSETELPKTLHNVNTQNMKEIDKLLQLDKNRCMENNILKHCRRILQQKNKENKTTVSNKIMLNKNIKTKIKDDQYEQPIVCNKLQLFRNNNDMQKIDTINSNTTEIMKLKSVPSIMKRTEKQTKTKIFNAKSTIPDVIPYYKYIKPRIQNKGLVKKNVLHNITGPKIEVSVGPGVSHKKQHDIKIDDASKQCYISNNAAEKLAQPDFNSILCIFNKLKEIKQHKVIRNINHLSSVQKNLLNEKISTVLDFPLDEAIFNNLVDLNIEDKQMPTIIRSKDPEPRQKDVAPKLSDFFVPEYTKDVCTLIHIKSRASKINEDWNIFKISNKILDWRHSLDDVR